MRKSYSWLLLIVLFLIVGFYFFNRNTQQANGFLVAQPFQSTNFPRPVVIYNRIPKTGSTTLTNAIAYDMCWRNGFHVVNVNITKNLYSMNLADQADFARNVTLWRDIQPVVYHGHLAFINFEKFGFSNPIYINLVREPLDRFISYYYFLRYGDDYRVGLKRSKAGHNETFDMCFNRKGRDCDTEKMWLQIPYFCGTMTYCSIFREPGNLEALRTAKRHLSEHYLLVGYTERLREMIDVLQWLLPEYFDGAAEHYVQLDSKRSHLRSTTKKVAPLKQTMLHLRADPIYKLEREFYDYAVQEFDALYQRLKTPSGQLQSKQYRYKKIRS